MWVNDSDVAPDKLGDATRHIVDRAIEESRRRGHAALTDDHVALAFALVAWDEFSAILRDVELNPREVASDLERQIRGVAIQDNDRGDRTMTPALKITMRLALHNANRLGRGAVLPADLFLALLQDRESALANIITRHGVDTGTLIARLIARVRDVEQQEEWLRKRFELPPFLRHYATNLNLLARQDRIPPIYGRDAEIDQVIEILCHRERTNSVMLVGEAGVGKTAIVEGLAQQIEFDPDSIPVRLRDCQIVGLHLNSMVAGTQLRGMFEDRIEGVLREVKERPNLILFVDEAHMMVGAGSALGAPSDAADVFKSALARGDVRMIGATTLGEYKKVVEDDEALARRFRCVQVDEPTIDETRRILHKLRPRLERNYSVRVSDAALEAALELSPRYMRHLHLPDKVIGWLDTAAVRAEIDGRREVARADIVSVISHAARIPEDMVFRDVNTRFRTIESQLQRRVIGQSPAVEAVARRLLLNKGPLKDGFDRPDGVLLFLGPTGVGKTELAKAVAQFLFGDEKKMIRLDMSEYQDGQIGAEKLIGMPRGIAGSERGGILTTRLKDNPYSVVLLDEIEKASPAVLNVFLQAFDEGWLTDGRGTRVYLSDAIVIMTSNVGSEHFRKLTNPLGFLAGQVNAHQVRSEVMRELERRFTPEFRNRIDEVVLFSPLSREEVGQIARLYLGTVRQTLARAGKTLHIDDDAFDALVDEGHSLAYGARFLKRIIDTRVKIPISAAWRDGSHFRVVSSGGTGVVDVLNSTSAPRDVEALSVSA